MRWPLTWLLDSDPPRQIEVIEVEGIDVVRYIRALKAAGRL